MNKRLNRAVNKIKNKVKPETEISIVDKMIKHFGETKRLKWLKDMENKEKDKASQMLEDLKEYFKNTPREQVLKDWEKSAKYDKVGPTVKEFIERSKRFNNDRFNSVLKQCEIASDKGETHVYLDFYMDEQTNNNFTAMGFKVERSFIRNEELTKISWGV